ncbi:filamentous hemagglutinin N-terminal domain-containing protein [Reyranella sp. CPCC 100927]|uniref:beta strand repeat-containing protein n=1 Tax=Reyranella sp. CPCC 100927 TaxID=2599616 RepID=UPI0015B4AC4D|nr:filamentous hemagglutinin N-terminal domain-containing protein [Reyranella sp. CPCC 100927]
MAQTQTSVLQSGRRDAGTVRGKVRSGLMNATSLAALVGWGVLTFTSPAVAQLPTGGTVVGGSATITTGTNQVVVNQTTNRGVIDWRSFSIGQGTRVDFQQPGASSVTLNRVTGPDPSVIAGQLTANGQIVLVNGAGVVFANGAQVNVGSLAASTANIRNPQAFMADGKLVFDVPSPNANAGVVNAGTITVRDGGLVGLVGNMAANHGVINARLGRVTIGGAETFTVDLAGDGLINFQIGQPVTRQPVDGQGKKQPLASNTGTINADGGVVTLTARAAGGVVDNVVNVGGAIRAQAVSQEGGVLVLGGEDGGTVNITGKLDVSGKSLGQRGGQVIATAAGGKVNVASSAVIDASGASGGGRVNIGGNYQGKGPLPNARDTKVEAGARITADATMMGNGGSVIVWADNATVFGGTISAKGGLKGGNGGFVETSGKIDLSVLPGASVAASAVAGTAGMWLLDPRNVNIVTGGAGSVVGGVNNPPDDPGPSGSAHTIDPAVIAAALNGGSNVTITTNAVGITPFDTGIITVVNAITWTTANTLTLLADGAININAPITASGNGNLTLTSIGSSINGNAAGVISLGSGTLNLNANFGINLGSAAITAGIVNFKALNGVTLNNAGNAIGTVADTASSAGSVFGISIKSTTALTIGKGGITAPDAPITIESGQQVLVTGNITSPGTTGILTITSTGAIGGTGILQTGGTLNVPRVILNATAGDIVQTGGNIIAAGSPGFPTALTATAAGSVDLPSATNNVVSLVGAAGANFRYVNGGPLTIGQISTVTIGITIGSGNYLDIAADTINVVGGARIGGIATGTPGASLAADNPDGVTVLRPTSASAAMVVGGAGGTTGNLMTEAQLIASVRTGTLRLGSIGRGAVQLGGVLTAVENPAGAITVQGLNFSGAGQLLQRLVLESGTSIQQTGAIVLTRGGGFEGALATAVRGAGSVELTNPGNSVTGLAHVAVESDTTLATQSGTFRYVDGSSIPVVSVAGPGTPLIGARDSGAAPGAPANSAILTNGGDVTLVALGGSIEFINGMAAIGAVARLNAAAGDIFQSAAGGVVANGLLAVAASVVDLTTAVGLNDVRFLSGSAAGSFGPLGDFRLINNASVTVSAGGVAGDSLVAAVDGVRAGAGATLELAIRSGDITVNNTTLTTVDGLVLLRRVAGATGSEIILNNVSFDSGSGSPNLVVLDLTGSPVLGPGSFAGLKTSVTPPSGTSAIPIGPNPDGGILLTNVNAGNTTVYLVGGAGSTISGSGTYGLLGVYVAHSNPIALTGSVRQIDPTSSHSVTAPFSEPFDSTTFAGFYVRRRGEVVDLQTFNTCVIGTGLCPVPPPPPPPPETDEFHIPDSVTRQPDDSGRLVGVPDLLLIDIVTDRSSPTPLRLSTVILVNQGNEYFFNVDEERRKQRAARGGQ